MAEPSLVRSRPLWADVVAEIVRSSAARAGAGQLWHRAGGVGVLSGPAPVLWVHGEVAVDDLLGTLREATEIPEIYVEVSRARAIETLARSGWTRGEVMHQLVCDATL